MTLDQVRTAMNAFRESVDAEASALKDPQIALEKLRALYSRLGASDRLAVNQVLTEWLLSGDDGLSFDARDLIREFQIVSAIPALQALEQELKTSSKPGAHEWSDVVSQLIMKLSALPET